MWGAKEEGEESRNVMIPIFCERGIRQRRPPHLGHEFERRENLRRVTRFKYSRSVGCERVLRATLIKTKPIESGSFPPPHDNE